MKLPTYKKIIIGWLLILGVYFFVWSYETYTSFTDKKCFFVMQVDRAINCESTDKMGVFLGEIAIYAATNLILTVIYFSFLGIFSLIFNFNDVKKNIIFILSPVVIVLILFLIMTWIDIYHSHNNKCPKTKLVSDEQFIKYLNEQHDNTEKKLKNKDWNNLADPMPIN